MAGKRGALVPRPVKITEYEIVFSSAQAERGWTDLKTVGRNALADAYDYLTAHPALYDAAHCYQLKGDLEGVLVDGVALPQWQYKVTNGARIWYVVDEPNAKAKKLGRVIITNAVTGHPDETDSKKNFR
ncbi:MAG: hypothetical protein LH475_00810 [Cryobacterium sp.]|uniref:hypothetical protein n=1 Tax=Cryobacterium sp. TaxID=1926290 RepID=UPI00229D7F02|nr:hypothetical protein [Cryobacterium sp.]MCY7403172.1 hypothetical protein [Cryobacterium sp.]